MTTDCLARRQVEFKELYRLLRPGKRVRLRAPLREGARGPIEPLPKNAIELRRDVRERRAPSQALREATVAEVRRPSAPPAQSASTPDPSLGISGPISGLSL